MSVRKVISADFASCWAKYMIDGKGSTFNKASSEILQKLNKDAPDIARAVLKSFASSAAGGTAMQTDSLLVEPAGDVKVALGCLNAIRSLQNSAEENDNLPLRWVLMGADTIGRDLNGRTRTPDEDALIAEELRQLLSLKVEPASVAAYGAGMMQQGSGERTAQDIMNSYATRSEEELTSEVNENVADGTLIGSVRPMDAKKLVKNTASLTLAAFRIFPFLPSLSVGPEAVNNFLNTLISTGSWGSAISVMEQYPAQTHVATFEALFSALSATGDWDRLAELALSARAIVHAASPHSANPSLNPSLNPSTVGAQRSGTKGLAVPAVRSVSSAGSVSGVTGGPFLVNMSPEALKQRVASLIQLCLAANTTVSLSAAKKLAAAYKLRELSFAIQDQEQNLKFQSAITKGKWQIFVQQLEKGAATKKLKFYNMLVQSGKYMEAAETYRTLRLHGTTGAVPVTRQQLEAQAQHNQDTYLDLPLALLENVLVIRDQRSLSQAAREMGLSLKPSTTSPIPTSTSAGSAAEMGMEEGTNSTSSTSSSNSEMEAGQQEKNVTRSVSFQSLASGLRAPPTGTAAGTSIAAGGTGRKGPVRYLNNQYRLVVGLDGEWRACVYQDLTSKGCSILQIATPDKVYILDFRTLCPERENGDFRSGGSIASSPRGPNPSTNPSLGVGGAVPPAAPAPAPAMLSLKEQTHHFLRSLLTDESVLKVGWDFLSEDIRMLRRNSKGAFATAVNELHSYLETKDVGEKLLSLGPKHKARATSADAPDPKVKVSSLSGACGEFLGRPLLKMEQMSNWDQRPLTRGQIKYASLDAHATLALFDAYLERAGVAPAARLGIAHKYYLPLSAPVPVRGVSK